MKFTEIKVPGLSGAECIAISKNYLVLTTRTGGRAIIYDSKFQLVKEITGLSYCYEAYISPKEDHVLLVSTGNWFYILSLCDFKISKYTIKGKYDGSLEGNGCWSFDGNQIFLCTTEERNNMLSALRVYTLENMTKYREELVDKYCLTSLTRVSHLQKYLLTGLNRKDNKYYLIWYDGVHFEEYCIEEFEGTLSRVEYDKQSQRIVLRGLEGTVSCNHYGEIFKDTQNLKKTEEGTRCSCDVSNGKYICVGTHEDLCCMDAQGKEVLVKRRIKNGVYDIRELSANHILVITWSGIKAFRIDTSDIV